MDEPSEAVDPVKSTRIGDILSSSAARRAIEKATGRPLNVVQGEQVLSQEEQERQSAKARDIEEERKRDRAARIVNTERATIETARQEAEAAELALEKAKQALKNAQSRRASIGAIEELVTKVKTAEALCLRKLAVQEEVLARLANGGS